MGGLSSATCAPITGLEFRVQDLGLGDDLYLRCIPHSQIVSIRDNELYWGPLMLLLCHHYREGPPSLYLTDFYRYLTTLHFSRWYQKT